MKRAILFIYPARQKWEINIWKYILRFVGQFVRDWYSEYFFAESPNENSAGLLTGQRLSPRGGSFWQQIEYVRTTERVGVAPSDSWIKVGFRCARTP